MNIKLSAIVVSIVLLLGLNATSVMAKCGGMATAKPAPKCGAGKCGAVEKTVTIDTKKIEAKMAQANNMKCGASKKNAIIHAKKLHNAITKADGMKCGAAKQSAIMKVKVN